MNNPISNIQEIIKDKTVLRVNDVVKSPLAGFRERQNAVGTSSVTEKDKLDSIQAQGTQKMRSTVGFFETESGTKTVAYFAPKSTSGVVRGGSVAPGDQASHANNYTTITVNSNGIASAIVGAAQGLKQEYDEKKGKFKKSTNPEIYKEEALYQMAQAIVAAQKVQKINNPKEPDTAPSVIMIGNYMSKSSNSFVGRLLGYFGFGTDDKTIKVREKVIQEMSANGLNDSQLKTLKQHIQDLGGNHEVVAKIGGPSSQGGIPLVFNQQGLNSARAASENSDNAIVDVARKLVQNKPDPDDRISQLIQAIDEAKQKIESQKGISSELSSIRAAKQSNFIENTELHQEALKIILVQEMGGAFVGGCQSAKDRFGALATLVRTYNQFIAETGTLPPAFGSKEYNEDKNIQERMDRIFAEQWMSGAAQFIANSNTPGAFGLKNNEEILTNGQRQAIERAVALKIKEDPAQKDMYISFLPKVSNKLAGLNKVDEADVQKQEKFFTKDIDKKVEKILEKSESPKTHKSSFSNVSDFGSKIHPIDPPLGESSNKNSVFKAKEQPSISNRASMTSGSLSEFNSPAKEKSSNKLH